MVDTFEAVAKQCQVELYTADGTRRFGGHSVRATGVQALALAGVPVDKIRIMARHSSDAIFRYVSTAPLATLRQDLGLSRDKALCTVARSSAGASQGLLAKLQDHMDTYEH